MTEKTLTFIPTLGSLHDKFSVSLRFVVDATVISPSGNSMKSYMVFFSFRRFNVSIRFVDLTVISPSGISVESYMLYYPDFLLIFIARNEKFQFI